MKTFTRDLNFVNFNGEEMQWVKFNNVVVYEAWKKLIASGVPPITLQKCKGVDLVDYKIYGNSVQDGTPTPDNPVEIESVGEKTKNLLKLNDDLDQTINGLEIKINSDKSITVNGTCTADTIVIIGAMDYILGNSYFCSGCPEGGSTSTYRLFFNYVGADLGSGKTFTPSSDFLNSQVRLMVYNGQICNNLTFFPMVCIGKKLLSYEPYGYKIPVKVSGKNLFDKRDSSMMLETRLENDGKLYSQSKYQTVIIPVKPNTKYTINVNVRGYTGNSPVGRNAFYTEYPTIGTTVGEVNSTMFYSYYPKTITTPSNAKYWAVWLNRSYDINQQVLDTLMIEECETATTYEPYFDPVTTNIYLDEPLRKIGDYADYIDFENKKVIRKIKLVELNKDMNWSLYISVANHFQVVIGDNYYNINANLVMSNYYQAKKSENTYYWPGDYAVISVDGSRIRFKNKDISTLEEWINWLSSLEEKLYVIYRLATPAEETIELPTISTNKGTNIIEVDTSILPSNMEVKYYGKE